MKVTRTGADLYEKVKKVLRSLGIPIHRNQRKYGRTEQCRVFAYHQQREEYKESRFDNTPLFDTKSVREIPQNYQCCYSCFKTW